MHLYVLKLGNDNGEQGPRNVFVLNTNIWCFKLFPQIHADLNRACHIKPR